MMKKMYILMLLVSIEQCMCARILCVFPTPSVSFQEALRAYAEELVERGHTVVLLTTHPVTYEDPKFSRLTQVDLRSALTEAGGAGVADQQLRLPGVRRLIAARREAFDLLVLETRAPAMYAFAEHFDVPIIGICSSCGLSGGLDALGCPPDAVGPHVHWDLTFVERVYLVLKSLSFRYLYRAQLYQEFNEVAKKHFGENLRPVEEIQKRTDIFFINSHPLIDGVTPVVPGIVYVGGFHIKPAKPLPKKLAAYLDNSTSGVVYFSLGASGVESKMVSAEKLQVLLLAFKELSYDFLWKCENEAHEGITDNVFAATWIPQQDVLGHRNIKAFVTDGDQQSMMEGFHFGVPMVGMPLLADQRRLVGRAVRLGAALELEHGALSKGGVMDAVRRVAGSPGYKVRAVQVARLLADEPMSPMDRAMWWTSYVIRHKGADPPLRTPMEDEPLYRYFFLDVIAFCASGLMLSTVFVLFGVKALMEILTWKSAVSREKTE